MSAVRPPGPGGAVSLPNAAATESAGQALGLALETVLGPRHEGGALIVGLAGGLGAGKTTLARAALRALGVAGTVRSPTYTIAEPYETRIGRIWHLDLYRIADPDELEYIAIRDLVSDCRRMSRRMAGARARRTSGARLPRGPCPDRTREVAADRLAYRAGRRGGLARARLDGARILRGRPIPILTVKIRDLQ